MLAAVCAASLGFARVGVRRPDARCVVPASGSQPELDLTPLESPSEYSVPSKDYGQFEYLFNVCAQLKFVDAKCPAGTLVCERRRESREGNQAFGTVQGMKSPEWNDGEVLVVATGGACTTGAGVYESRLHLVCDAGAEEPVARVRDESFYDCYVDIELRSKVACAGPPPPPPGATYKCVAGECAESDGGISREQCDAVCGPAPPPPPKKYRCEEKTGSCEETDGEGASLGECRAACRAPAADKYKCVRGKCEVANEGGVDRETCEAACQ